MSLVSPTQTADGAPRVAANINTPVNQLAAVINGGLDDSNIASGAALDAAKLAGGATGMFGAWTTWAPVWTNLTVGNGTLTATYKQIGKTVALRFMLVFGSTTAVAGALTFTLPVAAAASYGTDTHAAGSAWGEDFGVAGYPFFLSINSTTTGRIEAKSASGTYVQTVGISSTVPFTWGTGDKLSCHLVYEAA